jgi:hypothetical protein
VTNMTIFDERLAHEGPTAITGRQSSTAIQW